VKIAENPFLGSDLEYSQETAKYKKHRWEGICPWIIQENTVVIRIWSFLAM